MNKLAEGWMDGLMDGWMDEGGAHCMQAGQQGCTCSPGLGTEGACSCAGQAAAGSPAGPGAPHPHWSLRLHLRSIFPHHHDHSLQSVLAPCGPSVHVVLDLIVSSPGFSGAQSLLGECT